jgi:zinc/manganese transport system substrate-binding protein
MLLTTVRSILNLVLAASLLGTASCGGGERTAGADGGRPTVVVTTSILGDMVRNVVGDQAEVEVVEPIGADPHEFSPSARQAEAIAGADLLVVNGAGLEQSMAGLIDEAHAVFTVADHVQLRTVAGGVDPHVWTDPHEMAAAMRAFGARAATLPGVDPAAIRRQAGAYATHLDSLDAEITASLAPIPAARRKLVTNHDAFGYFAARYHLQVLGAVIPSLTTSAGASASDLEALAALIEKERAPAIFAETTQPTKLAEALAGEVGGTVEVVELYTESPGKPGSGADTYVGMLRTDAQRIVEALS